MARHFLRCRQYATLPNRAKMLAPISNERHPALEHWQALEHKTKYEFDRSMQTGQVDHGFESITDSGIVRFEKPRAEIFAAALQSMHARPEESLYVGDVYTVDYLGARNAGLDAVLLDVAGTYRDRDLQRVESSPQLERWLLNK